MSFLFVILQQTIVEKWFQKVPSAVEFDDRLQYYRKVVDDISAMNETKDQECIRLNMGRLASAVKDHSIEWIKILGKFLHESAKEMLFALHNLLDVS